MIATIALFAVPSASAVEVRATRIDGSRLTGQLVGLSDGQSLELQVRDDTLSVPLHDLTEVAFPQTPMKSPSATPAVFYLADGGRIYGQLVGGGSEAVVSESILGPAVSLPFGKVAGIQLEQGAEYGAAANLFRAALADRRPGEDVLVTRSADDPQAVPGRIQSLAPDQGKFVLGGRERTFQTERIFGVVFAVGVQRPADFDTTFELADGSRFSGRLERADGERLEVAASFGNSVSLPLESVAVIRVRSDRVVYLSDLAREAERVEGRLHRPWPVRLDRTLTGRKIELDGRTYEKGIACHSLTELRYNLEEDFESFVATIGIDDAIRPRGSVVFRVLGDEEVLFDSGLVTGRDTARQIAVDVRGVNRLTLIVDYGDGLDLSDHAVWADARLIKPRPGAAAGDREKSVQ